MAKKCNKFPTWRGGRGRITYSSVFLRAVPGFLAMIVVCSSLDRDPRRFVNCSRTTDLYIRLDRATIGSRTAYVEAGSEAKNLAAAILEAPTS